MLFCTIHWTQHQPRWRNKNNSLLFAEKRKHNSPITPKAAAIKDGPSDEPISPEIAIKSIAKWLICIIILYLFFFVISLFGGQAV